VIAVFTAVLICDLGIPVSDSLHITDVLIHWITDTVFGQHENRLFVCMFYWPCISIHPCNENQLDALFTLSLFRQSTSTCFGHICGPSSGGILYIYNNWYVLCFLVDCLLAGLANAAKRQTCFSLHGWKSFSVKTLTHDLLPSIVSEL
jgi:hypothetical protein